jgi:hypothetical protein
MGVGHGLAPKKSDSSLHWHSLESWPFQRKPLPFINGFDYSFRKLDDNSISMIDGTMVEAVRTTLTIVRHPALFIREAFQPGSWSATLFTKGRSALEALWMVRGGSRYLQGKSFSEQARLPEYQRSAANVPFAWPPEYQSFVDGEMENFVDDHQEGEGNMGCLVGWASPLLTLFLFFFSSSSAALSCCFKFSLNS